MQKLLFLAPVFQEKIWGGKKLEEEFHYSIPSIHTGECWAISAHRNGDCHIKNGPLKGKTLSFVYQHNRELFNHCQSDVFPLLVKIIDANNNLSVQVHPDDEYALKNEQELGKTECWYILDCKKDAEMIFGHTAQTKEEFTHLIKENKWDQLLKKIKIKPGDFFYVPSGTIHALCEGTLVLETQQSSDTTYRVYDYNRKQENNKTRPLHIKQAIDVTSIPHQVYHFHKEIEKTDDSLITTYIKSEFFTVEKWEISGELEKEIKHFLLVSVLKGHGTCLGEPIKRGDHFIVTSEVKKLHFSGDLELMVSHL